MTEPRRSAWNILDDVWSDNDPAVRRLRDALTLQPVQDAPGRREPIEPVSEPTPEPIEPPEESTTRRHRIGELIARAKAGDLSAVDLLRRLLDG